MNQSAVHWIEETIGKNNMGKFLKDILEQAKEMEKQQIIDAHFNGCETGEMFNNENRAFITDSKQYYNETFKSE